MLGLWEGRGVKTFKDYATASGRLPVGIITITLLATFITNADLLDADRTFNFGIGNIIVTIYYTLSFFLIGAFIAPRTVYFKDCITMGDIIGKLYGKGAQVFAGVLVFYFSWLMIENQIRAMGYLSAHVLGVDANQAMLIFGSVVVLYTFFGGMRSVAITDVVQFIALAVGTLVIYYVLIQKVGGVTALIEKVPSVKLSIAGKQGLMHRLKVAFFWGLWPSLLLVEPIVQRMLLVKDKVAVRNMFFTSGIVFFVIRAVLVLIGLAAVVWYDDSLNVGYGSKSLLGHLIKDLFTSTTTQSILFIGFLSVLLSTMDSFLLSIGITTARNIIQPVFFSGNKTFNQMKCARYVTLASGCMITLAGYANIDLSFSSIFTFFMDPINGADAYVMQSFISTLLVLPFMLGVMGAKGSKNTFSAFCIGFIVTLVATYSLTSFNTFDKKTELLLISSLVGTLAFFTMLYKEHKGFVTQQRGEHTLGETHWHLNLSKVWAFLKGSLPTPSHLVEVAQNSLKVGDKRPFLFSVFIILFSIVGSLSSVGSSSVLSVVLLVKVVLALGLMVEGIWHTRLKPYFPLYWLFCLMVCTSLTGMLLFLHAPTDLMIGMSLGGTSFLAKRTYRLEYLCTTLY